MPYAYDEHVGIYETNGIKVGFVSVNEVYDGVLWNRIWSRGSAT